MQEEASEALELGGNFAPDRHFQRTAAAYELIGAVEGNETPTSQQPRECAVTDQTSNGQPASLPLPKAY